MTQPKAQGVIVRDVCNVCNVCNVCTAPSGPGEVEMKIRSPRCDSESSEPGEWCEAAVCNGYLLLRPKSSILGN